jgi:Leucine carboxyl methyltransferase
VRVFEVDSPQTQMVKRETLQKVGIDSSAVTFVAADFEKDDWLACLSAAGFAPGERTLFLLEGVTMYLNREAVEDSLRKVASTAQGSVVAFDYFTTEALESRALYWRYGRAATKSTGETLKFGVDSTPPSRERLAELLRRCGLSLADQRTLGDDTRTRRAWGRVCDRDSGGVVGLIPGTSTHWFRSSMQMWRLADCGPISMRTPWSPCSWAPISLNCCAAASSPTIGYPVVPSCCGTRSHDER